MFIPTCMNTNMHIEGYSLVKRFWTVRANVFFTVSMDFQVTAQIAFVVENFSALRTLGCEFFCAPVYGYVIFVVT